MGPATLIRRRWAALLGVLGFVVVAGTVTGVVLARRASTPSATGFVCEGTITAPTTLTTSYRPELGVTVPVPDGWTANAVQGDPYPTTVIGPPCFIPHGARFLIAHLGGMTMAGALSLRCADLFTPPGATATPLPEASLPAAEGPQTIDGHGGSYEFVCPGGFIGPAWTVLLPSASGDGIWQLTYLGATGLGSGPWAMSFNQVLAAFSAP